MILALLYCLLFLGITKACLLKYAKIRARWWDVEHHRYLTLSFNFSVSIFRSFWKLDCIVAAPYWLEQLHQNDFAVSLVHFLAEAFLQSSFRARPESLPHCEAGVLKEVLLNTNQSSEDPGKWVFCSQFCSSALLTAAHHICMTDRRWFAQKWSWMAHPENAALEIC